MWEVEEEDTWSLMAIVKESARKAKRRGRERGVLNTTTRPDTITEINNYYLNPSPYQLDTSNTIDPFHNTFFYGQIGASNIHPFQNSSLFSHDQFDASNNNNFFGTLPPPVTGVTGFGGNVCNHHIFLDSYQNFLMMTPNPVVADEPLQDFREVSASADDNPIFQDGLRQLPPPEQFYLKPKPGSHKIPVTVYHYRRNRKMERRSVHRLSKDELTSSEKWAWRKYGQKPIKGSPYPRSYYKCSSLKSCLARKHVERCPDEPEIYIVTYAGTHDHPMPTYRNHTGPRTKRNNMWGANNPPPETQSPTSTMATNLSAGPSGSGSGSGENNVDPLDVDENGGGEEGTNHANNGCDNRYESVPDENSGGQGNGVNDIWNNEMIEPEFSY